MRTVNYTLTEKDWKYLDSLYPNNGKNSHIGKKAVDIAILYFKSLDKGTRCEKEIDKIDLTVYIGDKIHKYEVKGTSSKEIAYDRLKVSSTKCYDELRNGLTLLRVCNVGHKDVTFHFMMYGKDFEMVSEPRWDVRKVKKRNNGAFKK